MKQEVCQALENPGLLPVIRLSDTSGVLPLLKALLDGGITAAELTMTMDHPTDLLRKCKAEFGRDMKIGMGTVTSISAAEQALDSGADFLVSPFPVPEVYAAIKKYEPVFIMGAFSPYETFLVYSSGVDYIKIFPLNAVGPGYIKDLLGPIPGARIFPTGGITLEQIPAVFKAGAIGCGVGGALVSAELISQGKWTELTNRARQFVQAAVNAKKLTGK